MRGIVIVNIVTKVLHFSASLYYTGSHINPEVLSLQQAIQDMEMQIQEQIMKIDNTPNPILRVSSVHCSG